MNNQVAKGDSIDVVAPSGGVVSGQAYQFGSMIGISPVTAAAGVLISLALVGVYTTNQKNSAEAWTVGQLIYWDNTAKKFTGTATSNKVAGVAIAAAANPSSSGVVRLNGVFTS
jgi:predicted RecA/RadA family phage recombinase